MNLSRCTSTVSCGKTLSTQKRFDDQQVGDNRMRDWRERLDTRNRGCLSRSTSRRSPEPVADFFNILLAVP
jgi:hypothetical protein